MLGNGKVLVSGGLHTGGGIYVSSADLYDPSTITWTSASSMSSPHADAMASILTNDTVLVVGGSAVATLSSAEIYNLPTNTWTST
ncbi:unnamed protein product, partial [Adineta steineri]